MRYMRYRKPQIKATKGLTRPTLRSLDRTATASSCAIYVQCCSFLDDAQCGYDLATRPNLFVYCQN